MPRAPASPLDGGTSEGPLTLPDLARLVASKGRSSETFLAAFLLYREAATHRATAARAKAAALTLPFHRQVGDAKLAAQGALRAHLRDLARREEQAARQCSRMARNRGAWSVAHATELLAVHTRCRPLALDLEVTSPAPDSNPESAREKGSSVDATVPLRPKAPPGIDPGLDLDAQEFDEEMDAARLALDELARVLRTAAGRSHAG